MAIKFPIDDLTFEEKWELMQSIWDDLLKFRATLPTAVEKMTSQEKVELKLALWEEFARDPEKIPSIPWHADVLAARMATSKEENFEDWETAKQRIQEQCRTLTPRAD